MRLDKFIAISLNISRNDAKKYIKNNDILINNNKINDPNYIFDEKNDEIEVNGSLLKYEEYIYLMMNKPSGYLSATFDNKNKTIMELVPDEFLKKDLAIVGRLDKDTEGLIILTNDGRFIHQITSPKSNIIKKYYVKYDGILADNSKELVQEGIGLDTYKAKPGILDIINESEAYISITEGKFHEVKEIFKKLNANVTYLKRVKIGSLELGDLKIGEVIKLTKDEIDKIKE